MMNSQFFYIYIVEPFILTNSIRNVKNYYFLPAGRPEGRAQLTLPSQNRSLATQ